MTFRSLNFGWFFGAGDEIDQAALHASRYAWYQIARDCDVLVDDGQGGTEPRYTFNGVLAKREDGIKWLERLMADFDADIVDTGAELLPIQHVPAEPVAVVANCNVEKGEFKYTSRFRERYSAVAVTWNNPDNNYKRSTELVVDDGLVKKYGHRVKSLGLTGCTAQGQAHRAGRHYLFSQEHENLIVNYTAGLDHASIKPGDVLSVMDETVAGDRLFGRVKSVAAGSGHHIVTMDALAAIVAGGWKAHWRDPSGAYQEATIYGVDYSAGSFQVSDSKPAPAAGAVILFDSDSLNVVSARTFRVAEVKRGKSELERRISAVQYSPHRYPSVEQADYKLEPPNHIAPPDISNHPPAGVLLEYLSVASNSGSTRDLLRISVSPPGDPLLEGHTLLYDYDI